MYMCKEICENPCGQSNGRYTYIDMYIFMFRYIYMNNVHIYLCTHISNTRMCMCTCKCTHLYLYICICVKKYVTILADKVMEGIYMCTY
jgi:hypothetical protein